MFPFTPTDDVNEVTAFMADLGATQTWTNSIYPYTDPNPDLIRWMQFGDPAVPVRAPADAIATWYTHAAERAGRDNLAYLNWRERIAPWLMQYIGGLGKQLVNEYADFLLLHSIADVLENDLGYARSHAAATTGFYILFARTHWATELPVTEAFRTCARVADLSTISFESKIDIIRHDLPLGEIEQMLASGMPYTLVKEMFPVSR